MKKIFKILGNPIVKWSALAAVGLTTLSIVGANYVADGREKEIEPELEAFTQKVPVETEYNDTAIALKTLSAKLGFDLYSWPEDVNSKYAPQIENIEVEPRAKQAWEKISDPLEEYIDAQILKPNSEIDPPPVELQEYLKANAKTLEQIRQVIASQSKPGWHTNLTPVLEGDYELALPGYFASIDLQQILALDILEKQRQGQSDAAREMLEAAWQIHASFQDNPYLIGQLVFLINGRYIAGTMRKLGDLPVEWQERLVAHNYSQSMLESIHGEFFGMFNVIRNVAPAEIFETVQFGDSHTIQTGFQGTVEKVKGMLLSPVTKPWLRFTAIDTYQVGKYDLEQYQAQPPNICASDVVESEKQPAAWNILTKKIGQPSLINQVVKAEKYRLDLELTQKILQAKALAAETGKWPATLPNLESDLCPGYEWVYAVAEDGTMSLSLSQEPKWAAERKEKHDLPLTYSGKLPDVTAKTPASQPSS
ncbi:hypothetical protein IQ235_17965 [Oscillatoriales cyanobacterium LEGE 11467]|uniref:Uncharacterized protein n=1 Tax=Zarconia navalis LEGE 11467 TaxID=1828826 RepID=A0A928W3M5_9CYAN|nr:hypothetical protein [Zarconia navalis]MBE9042650.1 hypothetical protein [Zarconia navalis LEGE 11467]